MPQSNAREERIALHNQGMVGYALYQPGSGAGQGAVFHRLGRAEDSARREPGAIVVLVRDSGQLYYQTDGRATGPVLGADGKGVAIRRLSRRSVSPGSAVTPRTAGTQAMSGPRAARGYPNYESVLR